MFVSKFVPYAIVFIASAIHASAERTPCSHDITMGDFGACLLRETKKLHPEIKADNFTLEYLDPLPLGSFDVRTGNFIIKNKHTFMKGLSNTKIVDVTWDYNDNTAYITLEGNMTLSSDYKSSGSILFVPLTSWGKLEVHAHDAKVIITHKFRKIIDETGIERLDTYGFSTTQEYGLLEFNVRTGNKIVDGIVNAVMNYNWRTLAPIGTAKVAGLIAETLGGAFNVLVKPLYYKDLKNIL